MTLPPKAHIATIVAIFCAAAPTAHAQQCSWESAAAFPGDGELVRLARPPALGPNANIALFRAPLAVNTDGAPNSYHPMDPLGETRAINRFDNGISIRRVGSAQKLPINERLKVFTDWRDSGYKAQADYRIRWENVIAAGPDGKPCVFKSGPDAGYFGSLTALKNGLDGKAAGECSAANQLDQRVIPAIVLRGGPSNPLWTYGARPGDLVLALNPASGATVAAVIGDTGGGERIGEGSVALNMALLGQTDQPRYYRDAVSRLDTGNRQMIVAVLPRSRTFQPQTPFSANNITARVEAWAASRGYGSIPALAQAVRQCAEGL